jgi:hypothetical protein
MVIGARSNWFIDQLNPLSCEGAASQNSDLSHSYFRPVFQFVSTSAAKPKGQTFARQCDARFDVLSAGFVVIKVVVDIPPCRLVNIKISEKFALVFTVVVETGMQMEAADFFETPVALPVDTASYQETHRPRSGVTVTNGFIYF